MLQDFIQVDVYKTWFLHSVLSKLIQNMGFRIPINYNQNLFFFFYISPLRNEIQFWFPQYLESKPYGFTQYLPFNPKFITQQKNRKIKEKK